LACLEKIFREENTDDSFGWADFVLFVAELVYRVDMVTWNQYLRWGVIYIRLHSGRNFTEARIDQ